jgi:Flp pilus assembly protein TadD
MRNFRASPLVFIAFLALLTACHAPIDDDYESAGAGMAHLGDQMQKKGEVGPAIDFYRRALQQDPKNLRATKGLGAMLETWGDKESALDLYRDGVVTHPQDAELHHHYGRLLLSAGDAMTARAEFEKALELNPDNTKARSALGVALDYLGEHKKAQENYLAVLDKEPQNLAALNNLAYSHILAHHYGEAIKLLEPHVKNPSATPALRQNLALAYGMSGMEADARRIASMDMPPEKVEETLDYYRRQRAEQAVTAPYAELGAYATKDMAVAQVKRLQTKMGKMKHNYKPMVLPEVSAPGGTPRFTVRMMGCSKPDDIDRLCETMTTLGLPCTPKGRE